MSPTVAPEFMQEWKLRTAAGGDIDIELPEVTTASVIGISVAIAGNVLISLALNIQKLAHRRVEAEKYEKARERVASERAKDGDNGAAASSGVEGGVELREDTGVVPGDSRTPLDSVEELGESVHSSLSNFPTAAESEPLLSAADSPPEDSRPDYGSRSLNASTSRAEQLRSKGHGGKRKQSFLSRLALFKARSEQWARGRPSDAEQAMVPVDVVTEEAAVNGIANSAKKSGKGEDIELSEEMDGNESDYLKSKLWWLGFLLMNVGEIGNFISYAFAPASVVAPLGTFALIANCVFAPFMLHERFRKLELFGILIAIIGAVTVVLSSNTSDTRLDPSGLVRAIQQRAFVIYACVYAVAACILVALSQGSWGRRFVFVDVGLCALFGGFTVLATKGVSTLLTMQWIRIFADWITYPVIVVLIATGVGQIRYLNRALMRFDSKVVIPTQFVLFNLSAIIGSGILYGDFKKASFHQFVTFLYGCAATFAGVFIIAWAPSASGATGEPSVQEGEEANEGEVGRLGEGVLGRRGRATLVLPSDVREGQPILRKKHSSVSLMGLSPAQGLLLVHTPPREGIAHPVRPSNPNTTSNPDLLRRADSAASTPGVERRRAISWIGEDRTENRAVVRARAVTGLPTNADQSSEHGSGG